MRGPSVKMGRFTLPSRVSCRISRTRGGGSEGRIDHAKNKSATAAADAASHRTCEDLFLGAADSLATLDGANTVATAVDSSATACEAGPAARGLASAVSS